MRSKWVKQLGGPVKFDVATAKELMGSPIQHFFAAKLYVSHYCPPGCLRVIDEVEAGVMTANPPGLGCRCKGKTASV